MQESACVISYLNKNKIFVVLSTFCDIFIRKSAVFICFGERSFLGYQNQK